MIPQLSFISLIKELKSKPYTLTVLVGLVLFTFWEYHNYASAEDLERVKQQVGTIMGRLDTTITELDRLILLNTAEAIRDMSNEVCRADDPNTRHGLQRQLDALQEDYKDRNGSYYPIKRCG